VTCLVKPDKSRYVYVYLPSAEDKKRWDYLASEAGVPLSKFVIEIVENALAEEELDIKPREELVKQLGTLKSEIKTLQEELKLKNVVLDKYETELKRYRNAAFREDNFAGTRGYSKELVEILKQGTILDSYRLLEEFGIDPRDTDLVKSISSELENLEAYGLVTSTQRGWRWLG
jgi:predicted DNA-binding protein